MRIRYPSPTKGFSSLRNLSSHSIELLLNSLRELYKLVDDAGFVMGMDLSNAVRAIRKTAGLTQEQFARELSLTTTTIARYESGTTPNRQALVKLRRFIEEKLTDVQREEIGAAYLAIVEQGDPQAFVDLSWLRVERDATNQPPKPSLRIEAAVSRAQESADVKRLRNALRMVEKEAISPNQKKAAREAKNAAELFLRVYRLI